MRLATSFINAVAHHPSRPPTRYDTQSFVSASIAVQVQTSPHSSDFSSGTFLDLAPTKHQISSHWTRLQRKWRTALSWYRYAASATSTSSFVTVLIETSAMRLVARRLLPSTSIWMICARFAIGSLFMKRAYRSEE